MGESLFSFKVTRIKLLFERTMRRRALPVVTYESGQPRLDTLLRSAFYRPQCSVSVSFGALRDAFLEMQ